MSSPEGIDFVALTDVGKKRSHNEDNFLVDKKLGLYLVCDGMGGHAAGEVASALCVRTVHEQVKRETELLRDFLADKTGAERVSKRDVLNMLRFAANRASNEIHSAAQADTAKRGMGTTLAALLFLGPHAFIVHVGDSRIYLMRGDVLEQITEDHNVYNELIKHEKLTLQQVEQLAPKNAITRAVGVYEHCEPDTLVIDIAPGDRFLLCTDGLSGYFEEPLGNMEELAIHLSEDTPEVAIKKLVVKANERGGKDNITAVLVSVGQGAEQEAHAELVQNRKRLLSDVPLFHPLDDWELRRIMQVVEVVSYAAGATIIQQGDRGEELYIVTRGCVSVSDGRSGIATLVPGEHFGEMALLRRQPRSATVSCQEDSEVMIIRRRDFFEIVRNEHQLAVKLLWQFTNVLADRLAKTNQDLKHAQEELAMEDMSDAIFPEGEDRRTVKLPPPRPSLRDPGSDRATPDS